MILSTCLDIPWTSLYRTRAEDIYKKAVAFHEPRCKNHLDFNILSILHLLDRTHDMLAVFYKQQGHLLLTGIS